MPRRRKIYKKRPRRKRYRRRNAPQRSLRAPLPKKMITKLKYNDTYNLSSGVTAAVRVFNAGSVYDPYQTGVGHQPRGFDQLMPLYDHFVVIGAKCVVSFSHDPTSSNNSLVGISLRDSPTVSTAVNDYMEGTQDVHRMIPISRPTSVTISQKYSPKKFLGISHPLSAGELKGTVGSDPSESAYFHVYNAPVSGGTSGVMQTNVDIEYIVAFIEPRQPSQS